MPLTSSPLPIGERQGEGGEEKGEGSVVNYSGLTPTLAPEPDGPVVVGARLRPVDEAALAEHVVEGKRLERRAEHEHLIRPEPVDGFHDHRERLFALADLLPDIQVHEPIRRERLEKARPGGAHGASVPGARAKPYDPHHTT